MLSHMLKAKLHMAKVTQAELWYDGSCAIDADLLKLAGMREFEKIDIYNCSNGERFHTYIILAEPGSGTISMNGAAALRAKEGDRVIIATYGMVSDDELESYQPKMVYLNEDNSVNRTSDSIAMQTEETKPLSLGQ